MSFTVSYGASDSSRGGMALSRYYNPYYNPRAAGAGGGMAAFMFRQPEEPQVQPSQYYLPDRRRQTPPETNFVPPQENEVFYAQPQLPEKPVATEQTEIVEPTERTETSTTVRTVVPEFTEPEVEEVEPEVQKPRKRVSKRKQVKKPVEDEEDDDDFAPKMPQGTFFPMFFGWGRSAGGGAPGGATAVANAYSTGRGGVASSHATAYGAPRPDSKLYQ